MQEYYKHYVIFDFVVDKSEVNQSTSINAIRFVTKNDPWRSRRRPNSVTRLWL